MKVLWISDGFGSGYGGQSDLILRGLSRRGESIVWACVNMEVIRRFPHPTDSSIVVYYMGPDQNNQVYLLKDIIRDENPDVVVLFHDPRFLQFFFRHLAVYVSQPIIFWHIWDNDPLPIFNLPIYKSVDQMVAASRFVHKQLQPFVQRGLLRDVPYIPEAIDTDVFKPLDRVEAEMFAARNCPALLDRDLFVVGSVQRNLTRKRLHDLMYAYRRFADSCKQKKTILVLRTDAHDPAGRPLLSYKEVLGKDVLFVSRLSPADLNRLYNLFSVHVDISCAEGFGLTVAESMAAGVPNIVTETGGMQFLVEDFGRSFGWSIRPKVRMLVGEHPAKYLYHDFVSTGDVMKALSKAFLKKFTESDRVSMANFMREHYSVDVVVDKWMLQLAAAKRRSRKFWRVVELNSVEGFVSGGVIK